MAFADRVKETASAPGTTDVTLAGAVTGFQSFNAAVGVNVWFNYAMESQTPGSWETGRGYLSNSTTLVRSRVWESSNSDTLVNFTGTVNVWLDMPAAQLVDKGNILALINRLAMP
jgi:hypothetical protein